VVNCTTPANYFHVLRRQVHREFREEELTQWIREGAEERQKDES